MTNAEFQIKLQGIYAQYPIICKPERKTLNILLYVLRMDESVTDYNINIIHEDGRLVCIPSVKECFVSISELAMHVKSVECDEYDYGFDGLCLTVHVED